MTSILHDLPGLLYGVVMEISLGLTGGGGSIFAVPLLIYGLGVPVRSAIGLSLAVGGATAGFGAMLRLRAREIDLRAGIVFALGGMVFAPARTWIGHLCFFRTSIHSFQKGEELDLKHWPPHSVKAPKRSFARLFIPSHIILQSSITSGSLIE